jgi:hypothetical protein
MEPTDKQRHPFSPSAGWRLLKSVLVAITIFAAGISLAHADECSALRSQMRSGDRSAGPELASLRRQLAAIQNLERQRQCSSKSSQGGFFNACRDLATRRTNIQKRMAHASSSGGGASRLQARFVALGCGTARKTREDRTREVRSDQPARSVARNGAMYFCVRPSDGYFFPAPNSQFANHREEENTLDQCRYICDDATVGLYVLNDANLETENMISVEGAKPYKELPTAFRYRDEPNFKACNLQRYFQRVDELRARTVTPSNMANAIIPLPTPSPIDNGTVASTSTNTAEDVIIQPQADSRPIRMVGPSFFPPE